MMIIPATKGVCAIFGFGQGIGAAVARKWSNEGFQVAILSRSMEKLAPFEEIIPNSKAFACDVTKPEVIDEAVESIEASLGPIDVVVWNAGNGVWKTWEEIEMEGFDIAMKTNVNGLLRATQKIAPGMIERAAAKSDEPTTQASILVTGATASLRGKPSTVGFAPQKGAQRLLSQGLARDLGPKGVHVGLFIIDGLVGDVKVEDSTKVNPDAIAETYWTVANQPKSAWSFETEVRPSVENW